MVPGEPRLAVRRHRKVGVVLAVSIALALSGLGIESASASTKSRLALSLNPDRSSAVRLDGSTVKRQIYVFVRDSENLDKVDFYLDGRRRTKPPVRTDTEPPFDFAGTAADGTAVPYDTKKLADGPHRIKVVLTWANGTTSSRRANFTVANGAAITPTPTPTPTTAASPTSAPTTTAPTTTAPTTTDQTGFRAPSNTGIPDGTPLTPYTGPCTIREQGTVIDAKLINCSPLRIDTTGARITRSRVTGGLYSGRGESDGPMKVTVERSELVGNDSWRGISDSDYVVRDSYIHGGYSGGYCHRNCVIDGNYIEGSGGHASGFRLLRNAVFRDNTLWCKRAISETDGGCSSDLTMYQEFGIVTNVLVEGNLFKATPGWFCARAGNVGSGNQPGNHTYVRFIKNVFERGAGNCSEQRTGRPVDDFDASREGNQWTGNTYIGGGAVPSRDRPSTCGQRRHTRPPRLRCSTGCHRQVPRRLRRFLDQLPGSGPVQRALSACWRREGVR